MGIDVNKKLKSFSSWILILSIINLFIISLIPWISISENGSQGELFFNSIMMDRSENSQIKNIASYLFFIIDLLWIVIIINSISYISLSFYISKKYPRFSKILTNIVYINLIINTLIIYLQVNLVKKITQIDNLSLASAFSIIKFSYVPLFIGFILLILSIIYALFVIQNLIKQKRFFEISEKQVDKKFLINFSRKMYEKEPSAEKIISDFRVELKHTKKADWLETEEQKMDLELESEPELPEAKNFIKKKISFENVVVEDDKFIKSKDKINIEPFPLEKIKERPKKSGEVPHSPQFEKALTLAVEKKQSGQKTQVPETKFENKDYKSKGITQETVTKIESTEKLLNDEKKCLKKKIKIKCPQCKFVFLFDKNGNITTVKCPNCGKEGVIKYLNEAVKYPPLS